MSHEILDERREQAALLVANDMLTDEEIGLRVGITRRTLQRWRQNDAFMRRVADIKRQLATAVVAGGIAERQARVDALNDRWDRMRRVIDARAADDSMHGVPGGDTGLLIRQWKSVGVGKDAQLIEEYSVDTPLLKELRAHEQQAAQELGQWTEKRDVTAEVNIVGQIEALLDRPIPVHIATDADATD